MEEKQKEDFMRRIIRFAIIFWGIVAIFPLLYVVFFLFLNSDIHANLFGVGDGGAYVSAWLDKNANGVREDNEPPLANVCVWYGYRPDSVIADCKFSDHQVTDKNGQWGEFLAGADCDMIYIFANPPSGYRPTTDLASKGCDAGFGFIQENVQVTQKVQTISEFAHREITIAWIRNIAIGLFIFVAALLGTVWLEKPHA
ncbi:MAG: hypothetical protein ABI904_15240 [Chloroflexota bacterium]